MRYGLRKWAWKFWKCVLLVTHRVLYKWKESRGCSKGDNGEMRFEILLTFGSGFHIAIVWREQIFPFSFCSCGHWVFMFLKNSLTLVPLWLMLHLWFLSFCLIWGQLIIYVLHLYIRKNLHKNLQKSKFSAYGWITYNFRSYNREVQGRYLTPSLNFLYRNIHVKLSILSYRG